MEILATSDLTEFDKLHNEYFSEDYVLPDIKNIVAARVVKDNSGKVVASGFVKILTEAIIATDLKLSDIKKIRALDLLVSDLLTWCNENEIEQVHAFVSDSFNRILKRRYGFEPIKAHSLVLNLR